MSLSWLNFVIQQKHISIYLTHYYKQCNTLQTDRTYVNIDKVSSKQKRIAINIHIYYRFEINK